VQGSYVKYADISQQIDKLNRILEEDVLQDKTAKNALIRYHPFPANR
jgi:hypothetical protein